MSTHKLWLSYYHHLSLRRDGEYNMHICAYFVHHLTED